MLKSLDIFDDLKISFQHLRPHLLTNGMWSIDLTGNYRLLFRYKEKANIEVITIEKVADPHGNRI